MRSIENVMVVSVGEYGPFDDGRTSPYVDLSCADGSGVFRASLAKGLQPPENFARGEATCEVLEREKGGYKLRLEMFQPELGVRDLGREGVAAAA